jgi:hypothetical protein
MPFEEILKEVAHQVASLALINAIDFYLLKAPQRLTLLAIPGNLFPFSYEAIESIGRFRAYG